MDRRRFLSNSLAAAGGALLTSRGFGADAPLASEQTPGAIPSSEISGARFPNGFLWGMATACYQVEGAWNLDGKAELRRNCYLVTNALQGFADKLFIRVRAVNLSRVEEGHAAFKGLADCLDALLFGSGRSVVGADAHASCAQLGNTH